MGSQIENNSLDVFGCFGLIVRFLKAAAFIVKHTDYQSAIDHPTTAGSILQNLFSLCEIGHGMWVLFVPDIFYSLADKVDNGGDILSCVKGALLSL